MDHKRSGVPTGWPFRGARSEGQIRPFLSNAALWPTQCMACAAVAWTIAQGWWGLATPISKVPQDATLLQLKEQVSQVATRHLFDLVEILAEVSGDTTTPPDATIGRSWRLLGTYVAPGRGSSALLAQENGTGVLILGIGDEVAPGQRVVSVLPDGIELDSNAQRIKLPLRPTSADEKEQHPPTRGQLGPGGTQQPSGLTPFMKDAQ